MKVSHLIAAFCLVVGCSKPVPVEAPKEAEESNDVSLSKDKAAQGKIETVTAKILPIQSELKVAGTVASTAKGRALVTPPTSGKILSLLVSAGDHVKKGQALAVIESPELAQQTTAIAEARRLMTTAEADVRKSSSELELMQTKLKIGEELAKRQREFAKTGAFSQPSLQSAKNQLSDATHDLESAKQDEAVHRVQLQRAERLYRQELISRTDLEQARLAVTQDELRRKSAEAKLETSKATVDREEEISRKGMLNAREIQSAEADVRAAKIEVGRSAIGHSAAKSNLVGAQKALRLGSDAYSASQGSGNTGSGSKLTLRAPIEGTVTERMATIGQAIERSSTMMEIENLNTVWITANVPEKEIGHVKVGQTVTVALAAYPGKTFEGIVQLLGNHLDVKTRTMPVQCLVQNPAGALREDMFATVNLAVGYSNTGIVIPDEAVDRHGGKSIVFVAEGEKYEKRDVKTGRVSHGMTEILSGLKAGEKVVTKGLFVVESESRRSELKGEE